MDPAGRLHVEPAPTKTPVDSVEEGSLRRSPRLAQKSSGYNTAGLHDEDLAAETAEGRAASQASPSITKEKAEELRAKIAELAELYERDELLGKIRAHYAARKKDPPMGLNLTTVGLDVLRVLERALRLNLATVELDVLRTHYAEIKKAT